MAGSARRRLASGGSDATIREFLRWRRSSTAQVPGRCAEPGRNPGPRPATTARGPAKRTAEDRRAATPPQRIAGRGNRRNEKIGATFRVTRGTECFTMFGTMMDSKPFPPLPRSRSASAPDDAMPAARHLVSTGFIAGEGIPRVVLAQDFRRPGRHLRGPALVDLPGDGVDRLSRWKAGW